MLQTAIEQLEESEDEDKESRLTELVTYIADTYINEGSYSSAKDWYTRAFHRCEIFGGANTLQAACLITRFAEIGVLESDMKEFQKNFENLQRVYLLTEEGDFSALLGVLIDLSWVLCVQGQHREVQLVNRLISQIKQLQEEQRLLSA